ncbi:small nuclear ribonucleoprotein-associated protein B and N like protein [Babesia gibsoni]|uniref:Sm protein B n=1 Tax=Babesia gibsoni TaxID=33632 RepID=A0AAD8UU62_BABGI|nr:small nuclear ribonucleoprotein-associated protein B and N like protein [Babesia gibsoni]
MAGKNTRMQQWLQYRVRVTIKDGRKFVGIFIAFDKHMNIVLVDCEEFRLTAGKGPDKKKVEIKRTLGLVLLRGENIISFTAEAPPSAPLVPFGMAGPGKAVPAGRGAPIGMGQPGMPILPAGGMPLQAPMRGLVGAAPMQMAPQQGPMGTMPPRPM